MKRISKNLFMRLFPKDKVIMFLVYDLRPNGITKSLYDLIERLKKEKNKIYLITMARGEEDLTMPIEPHYLYANAYTVWEQMGGGEVEVNFREQVDIAVAYDGIFSVWMLSYFKGIDTKVGWLHSVYEKGHKGFEASYVEKLYEQMDELICVSDAVLESYGANIKGIATRGKLQVCYPFVSRMRILDMAQMEGVNKEGLVVVAIGRLVEEKGFIRLVSVHKKLIGEGYQHTLWIIGDGPLKKQLQKEIEDYKLQGSCKLLGYMDNPYPTMKVADVIVSSSYGEGLSVVLMEALILAKPIVATRVTGQKELLEGGLGILVENDEDGLCEGMKIMLGDEMLRLKIRKQLQSIEAFYFEYME